MPPGLYLGEFEQLLLLVILRAGPDAYAVRIARALEETAGRTVSRGALYTTLDRLADKGFVRWKQDAGSPERSGLPRRCYAVTPRGLTALRASRQVLSRLWKGLENVLNEPSR